MSGKQKPNGTFDNVKGDKDRGQVPGYMKLYQLPIEYKPGDDS